MWIFCVKLYGMVWREKKEESAGKIPEAYGERKKVSELEQKPVEIVEGFEEENKKPVPELDKKKIKKKSRVKKKNLEEIRLKKRKIQGLKKNYRPELMSLMLNMYFLNFRLKDRLLLFENDLLSAALWKTKKKLKKLSN